MLPKINMLARLTRDSQFVYAASGTAVCTVGLACSEKYGEKETTLFIDGTAFKKTAELMSTITKGQRVYVSGKLKTDQWQDKNTAQQRSKITMIIESFEFIEKKDPGPQQNNIQQPNPPNSNYSSPSQNQMPPDDGIPF